MLLLSSAFFVFRPTAAGEAETIYGYDTMNRANVQYSCLPSGCGTAAYDRGVAYTYNLAGMMTSEGDGAGDTYTYGRSIAGELTGITSSFSDATDPANIIVPGSVKNGPFGPTLYGLGNGLNQVNQFDTMGRIQYGWTCQNSTAGVCNGGTELYGYGPSWTGYRVAAAADTIEQSNQFYSYGQLGRLGSTLIEPYGGGSNVTYSYTYDIYGNRWTQSGGTQNYSASFNASNNQMATAGYDAAGNMTQDPSGTSPRHTYTYDADGNLTGVDGGATATYNYDSLNHRIRINPTRGDYEFVFDQFGRKLSTWSAANHSLTNADVWSDSGIVAVRGSGGSGTVFEHLNWVGTLRLRTSYNGTVLTQFTSLPWGDGLSPSGDDGDQYDFAGLDRDLEDNSEHAQFRQYSPNQGRWLTPDPYNGSYNFSNPQTLNRYSYALNNPVSSIDPSGLDCVFFDGDGRPYLDGGEDDDHSVDDINPKQCGSDGGDWIDGFVSGYNFDSSSGLYTFYSSDANNVYQTTSYNPEDQEGYTGTTCSGDCAVGFSQSPNDSGLSVYLGSGYIRLVANAPNNAPDPMQPTPTYNKCNQQAIAAAGPLVPDGQSIATTAVTTAASWLFPGTTWFKLARGIVTGQFSRLIVKAAVYNANFEGCMSANGVVIPPQQY